MPETSRQVELFVPDREEGNDTHRHAGLADAASETPGSYCRAGGRAVKETGVLAELDAESRLRSLSAVRGNSCAITLPQMEVRS